MQELKFKVSNVFNDTSTKLKIVYFLTTLKLEQDFFGNFKVGPGKSPWADKLSILKAKCNYWYVKLTK